MRFCISIAKINAFYFLKQNQRFFETAVIKPCLPPAKCNFGLIRLHFRHEYGRIYATVEYEHGYRRIERFL